MYSLEHQLFLKNNKRRKKYILISQFTIFILLLITWELLAYFNLINTFITSKPSLILTSIVELYKQNNLFKHIAITLYETIISFVIGSISGLIIAAILWWNNFLAKVVDPYLTLLNSLPKVALGPIIIIWFGAGMKSIIIMTLLISMIVTIMNNYQSFRSTDINKIKLLQSFKASKWQIFSMLILPGNLSNIVNTLKINISMSFIGVIMGEFLVSKSGIGYLIVYGSQVFNLNLVITGIFLLGVLSSLLYWVINYIEKRIKY